MEFGFCGGRDRGLAGPSFLMFDFSLCFGGALFGRRLGRSGLGDRGAWFAALCVQTYGFSFVSIFKPVSVLQNGVYIFVVCRFESLAELLACFIFKHSHVIFSRVVNSNISICVWSGLELSTTSCSFRAILAE